jgi:hypothetical protein
MNLTSVARIQEWTRGWMNRRQTLAAASGRGGGAVAGQHDGLPLQAAPTAAVVPGGAAPAPLAAAQRAVGAHAVAPVAVAAGAGGRARGDGGAGDADVSCGIGGRGGAQSSGAAA